LYRNLEPGRQRPAGSPFSGILHAAGEPLIIFYNDKALTDKYIQKSGRSACQWVELIEGWALY